jgi:hypothetical protein
LLDQTIFNLETNLGKAHTISPFAAHYQQKPGKGEEEEKKEAPAQKIQ